MISIKIYRSKAFWRLRGATNQAILIAKGIFIMSDGQLAGSDTSLATPTIYTNDSRVACNGGGGALGHPQVWLSLVGDGQVTCPYCSRQFAAASPQSADS